MGSPSIEFCKILNFLTVRAIWVKCSEWVDTINKLNLIKIGGAIMGFPP